MLLWNVLIRQFAADLCVEQCLKEKMLFSTSLVCALLKALGEAGKQVGTANVREISQAGMAATRPLAACAADAAQPR